MSRCTVLMMVMYVPGVEVVTDSKICLFVLDSSCGEAHDCSFVLQQTMTVV